MSESKKSGAFEFQETIVTTKDIPESFPGDYRGERLKDLNDLCSRIKDNSEKVIRRDFPNDNEAGRYVGSLRPLVMRLGRNVRIIKRKERVYVVSR